MPVPWEIEYYHREPRALVTPASDSRGRCRWVPDNDHYPERTTQFHILNAAEDLLEECEDALGFFEGLWAMTGNHPGSHYAQYVHSLRAAIAKARGIIQ